MNLSKFQFAYEKHGIIGFINVLLGKLGFKYRLENQLKKLIIWHGKNIERISKKKIINGNYKDVKIQLNKNWSNEDVASKYLGLYELEVQECIINSQKNKKLKKKFLINLGAGEGYHPIGLLKRKIFDSAILYETDENGQNLIKSNSKINKVSKKIKVFGDAKIDFLNDRNFKNLKLKDCFFLLDIEGDEFKLLNDENIKKLKKSNLLIELHPMYEVNGKRPNPEVLIKKLKKFFKIKTLTTTNRDLSNFRFLDSMHENEKWLLVNEGRSEKMEWLMCIPK